MKKIPTLFKRDPEDMKHVLPEVNPGCEWVLAGEGIPTRKYDGTCVMKDDDGRWWARREIKPGGAEPAGYVAVFFDENTGKTTGWEPVEQSAFAKFHDEALSHVDDDTLEPGTYELCGPKVNRNPEEFGGHVLVRHGRWDLGPDVPLDFEGLRAFLVDDAFAHEGIVWHHPDGRMVKLKKRDFA